LLHRKYHLTVGTHNKANRDAWLETTLKKIPSGSRILDAGAGEQQYKKFCTHLNYASQDFAQYDGKGDGKALQTQTWETSNLDIVSDITSIPEPDASFDAIMCVEVLEHLPEPILAIKEFSRLLKPDGHLILTAPFCSLTHMAPYHFYSGYNRYFYEKHLTNNGFKIIELTENGNFFEFLAQELRRLPEVQKANTLGIVKFGIFDKIAQSWLLRSLERSSKNDIGSKDLLNFGFHVYAVKKW
jgi:ubiquinone/menaquinone biosynthesis C-methylase UbiE